MTCPQRMYHTAPAEAAVVVVDQGFGVATGFVVSSTQILTNATWWAAPRPSRSASGTARSAGGW